MKVGNARYHATNLFHWLYSHWLSSFKFMAQQNTSPFAVIPHAVPSPNRKQFHGYEWHLLFNSCNKTFLFCFCLSSRAGTTEEEEKAVHTLSNNGVGERVRQQFVHHPPETLGDLVQAAPVREAGESLVPEPADEEKEAEREGDDDDQRAETRTELVGESRTVPKRRPPSRRYGRRLNVVVSL